MLFWKRKSRPLRKGFSLLKERLEEETAKNKGKSKKTSKKKERGFFNCEIERLFRAVTLEDTEAEPKYSSTIDSLKIVDMVQDESEEDVEDEDEVEVEEVRRPQQYLRVRPRSERFPPQP